MKRIIFVVIAIGLLGVARQSDAQIQKKYWILSSDTLKVVNPNWFIAAQNFIPIIGGTTNLFLGHQSGYSITSGTYNLGLGYKTLHSNTLGSFSIALGDSALFAADTDYNIAIGYRAMAQTTTGTLNTGIGYRVLDSNLTGYSNVGIGQGVMQNGKAQYQNTGIGEGVLEHNNAHQNTAVGAFAISNDTSGVSNVAVGYSTLLSHLSGNNNVAIGTNALRTNIVGAGNIAIGTGAGYNETGSNKLYISNSTTSTPLIYGDFSLDTLQINGRMNVVGEGGHANLISLSMPDNYQPFSVDTNGSVASRGIGSRFTMKVAQQNGRQYELYQDAGGRVGSFGIYDRTDALYRTFIDTVGRVSHNNYPLSNVGWEYYNTGKTAIAWALGNNASTTIAAVDSIGIVQSGGYVVNSSTQNFTNTTVLGNVTGLSIALQSGHTYGFEVNMMETVATSAGEKFAVTFSGTSSYAIYDVVATTSSIAQSTSNWTTTLGTAITNTASNVNASANIRGTIVTTSTGTLNIQYAQNTGQTTPNVIQRGSVMRVWQIN